MGRHIYDEHGNALGEDITMVYSGPDTRYLARDLVPCTQYTWRVIASNATGDSDVSEPTQALTETPVSAEPLRRIGDWAEWWDETEARSYFINEV